MNALLPLLFPLAQVEMDPLSAAIQSRGMVLFVLVVLIVLSVLSWVIIGSRFWALWNLRKEMALFRVEFLKFNDVQPAAEALGKKFLALPHVRLMAAVMKEMHALEQGGPLREVDLEALERSMRRVAEPLVDELESGLSLLGTVASAAPFIGLFGTVWGIMGAFGGLADSGSILQTVAPHIAQALVATAVGLLAAIPASIAYNGLGRSVRKMVTDLDGFGLEILNMVRRQHLRHRDISALAIRPGPGEREALPGPIAEPRRAAKVVEPRPVIEAKPPVVEPRTAVAPPPLPSARTSGAIASAADAGPEG